jgi:hypothetical protein
MRSRFALPDRMVAALALIAGPGQVRAHVGLADDKRTVRTGHDVHRSLCVALMSRGVVGTSFGLGQGSGTPR